VNPTLIHLSREFQRLDLLLHREVLRLRARYRLSLDEFRGLYVSDEQVDSLLLKAGSVDPPSVTEASEIQRARNQAELDPASTWAMLVSGFRLTPFEQDVLLLALAPEFDLKYETIYGYLNNDVTRKWPTRDLALRLFAANTCRMSAWEQLTKSAPLFLNGLLLPVDRGERPSALAVGFAPDRALVRRLIAGPGCQPDPPLRRLAPLYAWEKLRASTEVRLQLERALQTLRFQAMPVLLQGKRGSGRTTAAQLACAQLGQPLFSVEASALRFTPETTDAQAAALILQVKLEGGALLLREIQAFFDADGKPLPEAMRLVSALAASGLIVFVACPPNLFAGELLSAKRYLVCQFDVPTTAERRAYWEDALALAGLSADTATAGALSDRFHFTPGQIDATVRRALEQPLNTVRESLFAAARAESDQRLGKLAVKVSTPFEWEDLVLPPATMRSVQEAAAAIEHRYQVAVEWGMRPGSVPLNLNILFSGPSGTGKTMTAGVIARRLGLELYRSDLSGLVSKYIGETEKNLDRIFEAARESNAILFFDEADALFGKRSEIKDAHDRYANIEVSYLLQKMEEHNGAVILATNVLKNIDEAFMRRLQYIVEFPLPAETQREQLWRNMFPARAPVAPEVDFSFLARQFQFSGGQIRNISVDAAFLAAADGQRITMPLLVKAVAREFAKQGRVPSASEFREYFSIVIEMA
jgi:MoxR-like ATPase